MSCRINRRRQWVARLILEACCHDHSSFVTLSYRPADYPADGSVSKSEFQRFMKRLRIRAHRDFGKDGIRFFGVGEYGSRTWRAHYHAILFGFVPDQKWLEEVWGLGFVHVGMFSSGSAAYVAGYCLKKLTKSGLKLLDGRSPEFALQSRRPGIGALAAGTVARFYNTDVGRNEAFRVGLGREIRLDGQLWPLDRFIREKVYEASDLHFEDLQRYGQRLRASLERGVLTPEERAALKRKSGVKADGLYKRKVSREVL